MDFLSALRHTLQFEGGYANDPDDRGGETFRGISRRNWPDWPGWALIDRAGARGAVNARLINAAFEGDPEMERLTADFYRSRFWRRFESLQAPNRVRAKLFDTAVNVGLGGAVKMLQRAVNQMEPSAGLAVDGAIGPRTRCGFSRAVEGAGGEAGFLRLFCRQQADHYHRLAGRDPGQAKFLKGWLRRAEWIPS